MQGTKSDPGVIPRVVRVSDIVILSPYPAKRFRQGIFEKRRYLQQYQTSLQVSYMEIYKDEVYDLLVTRENVRASDSLVVLAHSNKKKTGSKASCPRKRQRYGLCRQP
jgi:hypothetical protein